MDLIIVLSVVCSIISISIAHLYFDVEDGYEGTKYIYQKVKLYLLSALLGGIIGALIGLISTL